MSHIKKEILAHMTGLELTESEELVAHFSFPEDFIGFQGHFPAKEVLPGVCQIQGILVMLEEWKKKKVGLKEIVQAKFLKPVSPCEKITCVCRNLKSVGKDVFLRASINGKANKIAELKLKISFKDEEFC
ncbi:MAG: hypothetical protein ACE5FU_09350 [Nitrospinota bacterium]